MSELLTALLILVPYVLGAVAVAIWTLLAEGWPEDDLDVFWLAVFVAFWPITVPVWLWDRRQS